MLRRLNQAPPRIMVGTMILEPDMAVKPRGRRAAASPQPAAAPRADVAAPAWLREAAEAPQGLEDAAFAFGAAINLLDAPARRPPPWAGAWRQRLALTAGAASARLAGRLEDEAALRDALLLTKPGDDVGPGGSMLVAWRRLATQPPRELTREPSIAATLADFGTARTAATARSVSADLERHEGSESLPLTMATVFAVAERHGLGRDIGAWLCDAVLAQRLRWPHAVPLAAARLSRRSAHRSTAQPDGALRDTLAAYARAAVDAADLSADLGRRAAALAAVERRLRAKGAGAVIARLLSDDAVVPSTRMAGISDRGMRRLFDRLVAFGAVRELSGRPTFRVYGL